MNTAFSTALSALNATSTAIDVVGNNLANLNTTGFKASEVSFYDLMTQPSGGAFNGTQVGLGTAPPITVAQFAQGSVQPTCRPAGRGDSGQRLLHGDEFHQPDSIHARRQLHAGCAGQPGDRHG